MKFKEKLKLANELARRKVGGDCGENLAVYVPFDGETRATLTKLGYDENEKFPVFGEFIDITFVADDIFPDGDYWFFDGDKFCIKIDEKLKDSAEREKLYKRAIGTWGIVKQLGMVSEECGELIVAINKYLRGYGSANVIEEAADAINMIEQLQSYFGQDEIELKRLEKLTMLKMRLEGVKGFES